jgi:hypothetical protein
VLSDQGSKASDHLAEVEDTQEILFAEKAISSDDSDVLLSDMAAFLRGVIK